ncbi:hypothetical protein PsYK624_065640 [Phanerochaete sordida]|uniref:DUF6533 domain-containing protein n=1 Tax=Phanerochaete sordida TaxID=48140 RepID=A0A9P3LCE7_9APHY|nr:hypothetical protein PsYK624_065640 [Phanerochaete sordida]
MDPSSGFAQLEAILSAYTIGIRVENASMTLAFYEYLITFSDEVDIFWKRKLNATSLLFLATRWTMVLSAILDVTPTSSVHGCKRTLWTLNILALITYAQVAAFSALRAFAMSYRNYIMASVVLLLGLVPFGTTLYVAVISAYDYIPPPLDACVASAPNLSNRVHGTIELILARLVYITRSSLLAGDTVVLAVTWLRTFNQWREARRLNVSLSVSTCLLRDGTCGLLAINMAQMLTYTVISSPLTSLIDALPPVLMNRFIINLRSLDTTAEPQASSHAQRWSQFSVPNFRVPESLLGNVGEDLEVASNPTAHEPQAESYTAPATSQCDVEEAPQ